MEFFQNLEVVDLATLFLHPTSDVVQFCLVNLIIIMITLLITMIILLLHHHDHHHLSTALCHQCICQPASAVHPLPKLTNGCLQLAKLLDLRELSIKLLHLVISTVMVMMVSLDS